MLTCYFAVHKSRTLFVAILICLNVDIRVNAFTANLSFSRRDRDAICLTKQTSTNTRLPCLFASKSQPESEEDDVYSKQTISRAQWTLRRQVTTVVVASTFLLTGLATLLSPVHADEPGVEVEASTLFTGENVMICKKRGPLGACLETERRTLENDNDKAKKYFKDPSELIRQKEMALRQREEDEGNALIQKLRLQSEQNREKNDLMVQRKTFENDQSATFGPFDRQVLIMNTDGRTFKLLENPQAMRLKEAGFIKDRQFVKQPTAEELEDALTPAEGGGLFGAVQKIFSGGSE